MFLYERNIYDDDWDGGGDHGGGLRGKTPAEASNIKIQGDNKWITIIQNAKMM